MNRVFEFHRTGVFLAIADMAAFQAFLAGGVGQQAMRMLVEFTP